MKDGRDTGLVLAKPVTMTSERTRQVNVNLPSQMSEVMVDSDLPPNKDTVNNVSHKKVDGPTFVSEPFVSNVGTLYRDDPPLWGRQDYYCSELTSSVEPGYEAWVQSDYVSRWHNIGLTTSLQTLIGLPESKLGQLPARIVRRMEDIHASTIAIESRDLPELAKLFNRRGALTELARDALRFLQRKPVILDKVALTKRLKELRESGLGLHYGLFPTIADVKAINQEVKRGVRGRRREFVVALNGSNSDSSTHKMLDGYSSFYKNGVCTEALTVVRVDGARVIDHRPPYYSQHLEDLSDKIDRLVGVNPAGLIWEVLPYSWAIDWFVSMDDILDNVFLRVSNRFDCAYWTSVKYAYYRTVTYEIRTAVSGPSSGFREEQYEGNKSPLTMLVTDYNRERVDPPSVIDSARMRGANLLNVFWLSLCALGFRK